MKIKRIRVNDMDGYIKKSEAVDVIVKYPYNVSGKTATAIKMIEDLPSADVVPKSEVDLYRKQVDELEDELASTYDKLENAKAEIETLKDNNEHLAVMLEETKIELKAMRGAANSYKMHYEKAIEVQKEVYRLASEIKAELPLAEAKLAKNVASDIFVEIEMIMLNGKIGGKYAAKVINPDKYAELRKKYTEGEDKPASEEKHFSPEDVSKMTPQEVREKYTAIRKSMERW